MVLGGGAQRAVGGRGGVPEGRAFARGCQGERAVTGSQCGSTIRRCMGTDAGDAAGWVGGVWG